MRNGKCVTIGYVSTLTGEHVEFAKTRTQAKGKREVAQMRTHEQEILARIGTSEWNDIDSFVYADLVRNVTLDLYGQVVI
jgi:hypothetical protein